MLSKEMYPMAVPKPVVTEHGILGRIFCSKFGCRTCLLAGLNLQIYYICSMSVPASMSTIVLASTGIV